MELSFEPRCQVIMTIFFHSLQCRDPVGTLISEEQMFPPTPQISRTSLDIRFHLPEQCKIRSHTQLTDIVLENNMMVVFMACKCSKDQEEQYVFIKKCLL